MKSAESKRAKSFLAKIQKRSKAYRRSDLEYKRDLGRLGKFVVLRSLDEVRALVNYYLYETTEKFLSIDIESKNTSVVSSKLGRNVVATIQLCDDGETAYVIPWEHTESPWFNLPAKQKQKAFSELRRQMLRLFSTPEPKFKRWIAHYAQFEDAQLLTWIGSRPTNRPLWCSRHLSNLCDENRLTFRSGQDLKSLSADLLGFDHYDQEDLAVRRAGGLWQLPLGRLARYGSMDVWTSDRLVRFLLRQAKQEGFYDDCVRLMDNLMTQNVRLESHLKRTGFRIDLDACLEMLQAGSVLQGRIEEIEQEFMNLPSVRKANRLLARRKSRAGGMKPLFGEEQVFRIPEGRQDFRKGHLALLWFVVEKLKPRPLKPQEVDKLSEYDPELAKKRIDPHTGKKLAPKFPPMDKAFLSMYASEWDQKDEVWRGNLDEKTKQPVHMSITLYSERKKLLTLRNLFVRKIWENYVRPTRPNPDCVDGHTRASYDMAGTVTGRGRSYDPNNQQIPSGKTPVAKKVKSLYISDPGRVLVLVDYRANEVRFGAICSGDKVLAELLWRGEEAMQKYRRKPTKKNWIAADIASDIHKQTAGIVFDIPDIHRYDWSSAEGKSRRFGVKAVIFGILYGKGDNALAQDLGISRDEAKELIQKIRNRFPCLFDYLDWAVEFAQENGYIYSPLGRRRRLDYLLQDVDVINRVKREHRVWKSEDIAEILGWSEEDVRSKTKYHAMAGRLAKNSPIQAIASDANNIGGFEMLTRIEPELEHFSALYNLRKPSRNRRRLVRHFEGIDPSLFLSSTKANLSAEKAIQDYLIRCQKKAKDWRIHNVVHDALSMSCVPDDVPALVSTLEQVLVKDVTTICEQVYGVNMIAPLAIEIDVGASYGQAETWNWTEKHLNELVSDLKVQIHERDRNVKIQPAVKSHKKVRVNEEEIEYIAHPESRLDQDQPEPDWLDSSAWG